MKFFKKIDRPGDPAGTVPCKIEINWGKLLCDKPQMPVKYRSPVMTCTHCKAVDNCKGWAAAHANAPEAPEHCLNRGLLGRLAAC